MLLGHEQPSDESLASELPDSRVEEIQTEEAVVSLHATQSHLKQNTMWFKGQIGQKTVCALLDSGSTHSFVDPLVLRDQNITIEETHPLIVMVANGARMVTDSKCPALQFSLQGHDFSGDFRLLQIQGYDLILRLDWLSKFEPMLIGWNQKWIEFDNNGCKVRLHVQDENVVVHFCEGIQVDKELKDGNEVMVAQIWLCEANPNSVFPSLNNVPIEFYYVLQ
jgi:Retroviral aspartyl protease